MKIKYLSIFIFLLFIKYGFGFFDPISLGIAGGLLGGSVYFKDTLKDYTYCKFTECCNDDYILDVSKSK